MFGLLHAAATEQVEQLTVRGDGSAQVASLRSLPKPETAAEPNTGTPHPAHQHQGHGTHRQRRHRIDRTHAAKSECDVDLLESADKPRTNLLEHSDRPRKRLRGQLFLKASIESENVDPPPQLDPSIQGADGGKYAVFDPAAIHAALNRGVKAAPAVWLNPHFSPGVSISVLDDVLMPAEFLQLRHESGHNASLQADRLGHRHKCRGEILAVSEGLGQQKPLNGIHVPNINMAADPAQIQRVGESRRLKKGEQATGHSAPPLHPRFVVLWWIHRYSSIHQRPPGHFSNGDRHPTWRCWRPDRRNRPGHPGLHHADFGPIDFNRIPSRIHLEPQRLRGPHRDRSRWNWQKLKRLIQFDPKHPDGRSLAQCDRLPLSAPDHFPIRAAQWPRCPTPPPKIDRGGSRSKIQPLRRVVFSRSLIDQRHLTDHVH